jgi:methylthioribose-1-phosphate isomerase
MLPCWLRATRFHSLSSHPSQRSTLTSPTALGRCERYGFTVACMPNLLVMSKSIPIEHRPPLEACIVRGALYPPSVDDDDAQGKRAQAVVMITPEGLDGIYNPSFDVTPAELITAIVTEKGVAVKGSDGTFDLSNVV